MEQYIESLSPKYGEANINWISKKRKKFVIHTINFTFKYHQQ